LRQILTAATLKIILMNGRLPFLDGLEATRRIRETRSGDQLRLWLSMARAVHAITLILWRLGVDDSIAKPFDFDWLRTYLFCSSILPLMQ
jgi:DNA-binding response OmpR family regulator